MRLAVCSDLHYDLGGHLTTPAQVEALAREVADARPDVIALAGDLGHGVENFRRCVAAFRGLAPHLTVLAGNHDVWQDRDQNLGSEALFERVLPGICADLEATWLEATSLRLGQVAVAGSMAWYDYSGIDPAQQRFAPQLPQLKRLLNNDAHWIDWPHDDPSVASRLGGALLRRLDALSADPTITSIAVVTHVPVLDEQMARKPDNEQWGISNAFFGNLTLGHAIARLPKVSVVVSGHTHLGRQGSRQRGSMRPLDYRVVPSDYGDPAFVLVEALRGRKRASFRNARRSPTTRA